MDELIDILDPNGNFTGERMMKSEAHKQGKYHPSVHVWFYTKNGEILIQQRAKVKDTHPSLWDVSVAGHIGAGEDVITSAIREVQEEIGLDVLHRELYKIGIFKYQYHHHKALIDCEFHHSFVCELKKPLKELVRQASEVDALSLISIAGFKKQLENPEHYKKYVPYGKDYYYTVFKNIQNRL